MADDMVRRLLGEQRRRLVASVLGGMEASAAWSKLSVGEQKQLREKVLASVGAYHDFCLDVIKCSADDTIRNEHALTLLQQVHDSQRRLERQQRTEAGVG